MIWIVLAIFSALSFGTSHSIAYYCTGLEKYDAMAFTSVCKIIGLIILFLVIGFLPKQQYKDFYEHGLSTITNPSYLVLALLSGAFMYSAEILQYISQGKAPNPGYAVAICNFYPLIMVILAWIFLHLKLNKTQQLGGVVLFLSVFLINE